MKVIKKVILNREELNIVEQACEIATNVFNETDDPDEKTIAERVCNALEIFCHHFDDEF